MNFNIKKFSFGKRSLMDQMGKETLLTFMRPGRDWIIGFSVASLLLLFGVFFIAYDFYDQFGDSRDVVVVSEQTVAYPEADVRMYAEIYEKKEALFHTLRKERVYNPVVPPMSQNLLDSTESLANE